MAARRLMEAAGEGADAEDDVLPPLNPADGPVLSFHAFASIFASVVHASNTAATQAVTTHAQPITLSSDDGTPHSPPAADAPYPNAFATNPHFPPVPPPTPFAPPAHSRSGGSRPRLLPPQAEVRAAFDLFADPSTDALGGADDLELVLKPLGIHRTDDELAQALHAIGLSTYIDAEGRPFGGPWETPIAFDDVRRLLVHFASEAAGNRVQPDWDRLF